MKTSKTGFAIIEKYETFKAKAYQDSTGVWTQGFGHTATVVKNSPEITLQQGIELLRGDIFITEQYIKVKFKGLRQCQFDALVSCIFNIGVGNFRKSNLYQLLLKNKDDKHIAGEWIEFRNSGGKYLRGLMRRRIDELALYYSW